MPDIYASIRDAPKAILENMMTILEIRAADPQQRAMLNAYLGDVDIRPGAGVLEIGCGTGAVTRVLATRPGVVKAVGVDPSPVLVARARALAAGLPALTFEEADGRALPFANATFDLVVCHTTLCHVPQPETLLKEAVRVLRPGGSLAVFDGDYACATVANGAGDPLEACADAFREHFIHDPWLARRLPALIRSAGLHLHRVRSFGHLETSEAGFMLPGWVDRGADALETTGRIGADLAAALKAEARRRVAAGEYFGYIHFMSCVGRKPA